MSSVRRQIQWAMAQSFRRHGWTSAVTPMEDDNESCFLTAVALIVIQGFERTAVSSEGERVGSAVAANFQRRA